MSFHSHDRLLRADTFSTKTIIVNDVPTSELRCLCDRWCCVLLVNMMTALGIIQRTLLGVQSLHMLVRVRSMPSTLHAHGRNVSSYLPSSQSMTSLQPRACLGRHKQLSSEHCIQASEVARYGMFMGFWELLHVSLHWRSTSQGRFSTKIWLTPVILFKVQQMMNRRQRSLSRCSRPVVPRFDTQQPWNEIWIASPGWLFTMVIVSLFSHFFRFVLSDFFVLSPIWIQNPIWRDEEIAVGNFGLKLK